MNVALVFAGGAGTRMGASVPKQFLQLCGKPVLVYTLGLFQNHPEIDRIRVVAPSDYIDRTGKLCRQYGMTKVVGIVEGGDTAQDSIYNGLEVCAREDGEDAVVLLHDGVRPYLEPEVISRNISSVREFGNAITITPCFETIVVSADGRCIDQMPRRAESYTAQAPQSFRVSDILAAHERIRAEPTRYADMVDQATICHHLGIPVHLVMGSRGNIKVTTSEDLHMLGALLRMREGAIA